VTDIHKTEVDFIVYSADSLTWFAFNIVGCVMPVTVIIIVMKRFRDTTCAIGQQCMDPEEGNVNLSTIDKWSLAVISLQSAGNILQMYFNLDLYIYKPLSSEENIFDPNREAKRA
jgi:hypothetical protein